MLRAIVSKATIDKIFKGSTGVMNFVAVDMSGGVLFLL